MTIAEMQDYIADYTIEGITLTEAGRNAAITILERRKDWTDAHNLMLWRLQTGVQPLPFKLGRLVNRTRLGDALELARDLTRKTRRNQKCKARRKAARARRGALAA
jgi:hypothetical protein